MMSPPRTTNEKITGRIDYHSVEKNHKKVVMENRNTKKDVYVVGYVSHP